MIELGFVAVVALAVSIGLWRTANGDADGVPMQVADLRRVGVTTGQEAVAQISSLHGKDVGVTSGYLASYSNGTAHMEVWVAEINSVAAAQGLLTQMTDRIAGEGGKYYTDLQPVDIDGKTVYSVRAGQQSNFYWVTDAKVIWITIDGGDPVGIARSAIRTF